MSQLTLLKGMIVTVNGIAVRLLGDVAAESAGLTQADVVNAWRTDVWGSHLQHFEALVKVPESWSGPPQIYEEQP